MNIAAKLDQLHYRARGNRWLAYFATLCRVALAAGFLPSGFVKINGERFTDLVVTHPMGNYLEALSYTGYYYTSIGVMQVVAAILLLIPRTAVLGAIIYLPIIVNICILTFALRFDGSLFTAPLMVLACLYVLVWDYHKWKFIIPLYTVEKQAVLPQKKERKNKFPILFFGGVFLTFVLFVFIIPSIYDIMPRNTMEDCRQQCAGRDTSEACYDFCDCIFLGDQTLVACLDEYHAATDE